MARLQCACNPIDDKRGTAEYRTRLAGVLAKRAAKSRSREQEESHE